MDIVRPRSHPSDSLDPTSWHGVKGSVSVIDGDSGDEECQFRSNRRRGDSLPSPLESTPGYYSFASPSSSDCKGLNNLYPPPKFPMTPAEFHLCPSARPIENTRNSQKTEMEGQEECLGVGHLTTLRSAAFWELRRSVIENGEGFIRRMRDYEQSRLHQQVRQKAKERKKRGHKSSTLRSRCKARPNAPEASDEDDVLICSEVISKGLSRWSPLATRASPFDPMDVDGEDMGRGFRSDCSQVQLRCDEGMLLSSNSLGAEEDSESLLSYSESASPTSSSSISLPLPQSFFRDDGLLALPTPTDKALADLNVAFSNGACSITDYSPIWTYQQQFSDENDSIRHGDLWR